MPEMNENVSSGADDGLERSGAAQEAAALLRTAATALLSAAEIWSTSPTVAASPVANAKTDTRSDAETPVVAAPAIAEVAQAAAPEIVEASEAKSPSEQPATGR